MTFIGGFHDLPVSASYGHQMLPYMNKVLDHSCVVNDNSYVVRNLDVSIQFFLIDHNTSRSDEKML